MDSGIKKYENKTYIRDKNETDPLIRYRNVMKVSHHVIYAIQ